jgi:ProP effector
MPAIPQPHDSILALLIATYPVFRDARPLVIGIHKTILEARPEIGKKALSKALQRHTASTKYLKSVAAGGSRFDLNGTPVGEITPEQQEQATRAIKERFRKQAEQRRELLKAREHHAKLQLLAEKFNSK